MDRKAKLDQAFIRGLGLSDTSNFNDLGFSKTEGWDSIGHMKLIAALEEEFAIRLDVSDVLALNSYQVAQEIVTKYAGKAT